MIDSLRDSVLENGKTYLLIVGVLGLVMITGLLVSGPSLMGSSLGDYGGNADTAGSADLVREQSASLTADSPEYDRGSGGGSVDVEERKRITTMRMSFEVPEVVDAQARTQLLAEDSGGWVESESLSRHNGDHGSMTVRVPKNNLSGFLNELENEDGWKLDSKNRNTDDVTDRYTELSLELKNKRQELNRLESLVNRTDEVDSLIKIQERMSNLRSRIQYLDNQLNEIDQRVDYVRVDIDFEEPQPITAEFELREAIRDSYRGIFSSLNLLIVGAGHLLPFGVIAALIHWARKRQKSNGEE